jgi:hypothetical protein
MPKRLTTIHVSAELAATLRGEHDRPPVTLKKLTDHRRGGRRSPHSGRKPGYSADQLERAKAAWDGGRPVFEVRDILGLATDGGVYQVRDREHWTPRTAAQIRDAMQIKKPALGTPDEIAAAARAEGRAIVTPRRRCEACQGVTAQDPCLHCGAPWNNT